MPIDVGPLRVSALSRFIALTPLIGSSALSKFAGKIVQDLDPLRAPLTAKDRARRNPDGLSENQRTLLDRWGYPYVLQEFRFHMTLTGPIQPERIQAIREFLEATFQSDVPNWRAPVSIDALTIFKQHDRTARFRIHSRYPLAAHQSPQ